MRRLSSRMTIFWRLFATVLMVYFAAVTLYILLKWLSSGQSSQPVVDGHHPLLALILFDIMSVFFFVVAGTLKQVKTDGNCLFVSNYFKEIAIPIANVRHVDGPDISSLRRIKLILKEPSVWGDQIVFTAGFFPAKNVAAWLKERVDACSGTKRRYNKTSD